MPTLEEEEINMTTITINVPLNGVAQYSKAVQALADVSKGGKDYVNCSWMDISIRVDREKEARAKLVKQLGELAFAKLNIKKLK